MNELEHVRECLRFGPMKVCIGDIIILVLSRGETIRGVFMGASHGFMALSPMCNSPPAETIAIRFVSRIIMLGRCQDAGDMQGMDEKDKSET